GKLSDLIFDDPQRLSHRALWRIFKLLEKSPPYKVLMAIRPLRSAFLKRAVERSRKEMGDLAGLFE
ncbi:MAG: 4Fe-4S ferredoxin, partial [Planctomycetota bacterium]